MHNLPTFSASSADSISIPTYNFLPPQGLHCLHLVHLPCQPSSFHDNINGVKSVSTSLDTLQQSLENMYALTLQKEQFGHSITSLQV